MYFYVKIFVNKVEYFKGIYKKQKPEVVVHFSWSSPVCWHMNKMLIVWCREAFRKQENKSVYGDSAFFLQQTRPSHQSAQNTLFCEYLEEETFFLCMF